MPKGFHCLWSNLLEHSYMWRQRINKIVTIWPLPITLFCVEVCLQFIQDCALDLEEIPGARASCIWPNDLKNQPFWVLPRRDTGMPVLDLFLLYSSIWFQITVLLSYYTLSKAEMTNKQSWITSQCKINMWSKGFSSKVEGIWDVGSSLTVSNATRVTSNSCIVFTDCFSFRCIFLRGNWATSAV